MGVRCVIVGVLSEVEALNLKPCVDKISGVLTAPPPMLVRGAEFEFAFKSPNGITIQPCATSHALQAISHFRHILDSSRKSVLNCTPLPHVHPKNLWYVLAQHKSLFARIK